MKILANALKSGNFIKLEEQIYTVLKHQHVKPGKGGAFVRLTLQSILKNNVTIEKTFRSEEKLFLANLIKADVQFSHQEDELFCFLNLDDYEQYFINKKDVASLLKFLKPELQCTGFFLEGELVSVAPPLSVDLRVMFAEPGIKGDSVSATTKNVKLETGLEIPVPLFIKQNDIVSIDTKTGKYINRKDVRNK